jgi:hypothetical protein
MFFRNPERDQRREIIAILHQRDAVVAINQETQCVGKAASVLCKRTR